MFLRVCYFLPNKVLSYNIQLSTLEINIVFIKARCTIFKIVNNLNITIFQSIFKSLLLHTFKNIVDLSYMIIKSIFFFNLFIVRKVYSQNLNSLFRPSIFESLTKTFKTFVTDVWSFTKKVMPSPKAVCKKSN